MLRKILVPVVCGLVGCTAVKNDPAREAAPKSLEPLPRNAPVSAPASLAQLKREVGQTEFLSLETLTFRDGRESAPHEGEEAGGAREVQESDIFKVAPGKMLYLLNSYRGLQAISFAKGEAQGELLGRVFPEARGVFHDMYLDPGQRHVHVLSTSWNPETTRVTTYDVADPKRLRVVGFVEIEGRLADSRLVGEILYVATRAQKDDVAYGAVTSLRLNRGATKIESRRLTLVPQSDESMNIVQVKDGEKFRTYLLAYLEDSAWGLGRKAAVEVVDISSPEGKIASVMTARVSGSIERRSSSTIKGGALVVVSNAFNDEDDEEARRLRVVVESFALPGAKSKIISAREEASRRARLEKEIQRIESADPESDARAAKIDSVLRHPDYGLAGIFVKDAGGFRKSVADRKVSVGAADGQHAQVKDVRWNGNQLYVFWVPTDRVDPFELFDVTNPLVGTPHVARLEFAGWIERAIPVNFGGREYVIGLGWIESEGDRRHIQAKAFEVELSGSGAKLRETATLKLDSSEIFSNFNTGDKFIEVNFKTPSSGEILFEASVLENGVLRDGGKLLAFDLAAGANALTEGSMLLGEGAWLRRVFTNPELNRIQAFSDEALATFGSEASAPASGARTASAIQVLELARNIVAHAEIPFAGATAGVQIVSRAAWTPGGSGWKSSGSVELRLTHADQPDAEVAEVLSTLKLDGGFYAEHLIVDGRLLVITESSSFDEATGKGRSVKHLYLVTANVSGLVVADTKEIVEETGTQAPALTVVGRSLLRQGREVWLATGARFYSITVGNGIGLAGIEMDSCKFAPEAEVTLVKTDDRPAIFVRERVDLNEPPFVESASARITRNFLVRFDRENDRSICGARYNIPGEPLLYTENFVVLKDDVYKGFEAIDQETDVEPRKSYDIRSETALTIVRLTNVAMLSETTPDARVDEVVPAGEYLLRVKREEEDTATTTMEIFGVEQGRLTRASQALKTDLVLPLIGPVFEMNEAKRGVFLTSVWTQEAALFSFESGELKPVPLRAPGKTAAPKIFLPGWAPRVLYDGDAKSLVISAGLYGNFQFYE